MVVVVVLLDDITHTHCCPNHCLIHRFDLTIHSLMMVGNIDQKRNCKMKERERERVGVECKFTCQLLTKSSLTQDKSLYTCYMNAMNEMFIICYVIIIIVNWWSH